MKKEREHEAVSSDGTDTIRPIYEFAKIKSEVYTRDTHFLFFFVANSRWKEYKRN